jgi:hypothetical protein
MPHATKTSSVDVNINSSQSSRQNKSALPAFTASRSEATNTHTHTHTHTPKVQHRHEKQPKSSPPRHEVCSTQPVKTRDRTQQTTSNQEPNPQIKLPRVCPGFPRREKRIRDPQHFTSHITASLQSPLRHFEHGLRTINQRRHPSKTQRGTGVFFATTAVNESS